jgi:hypothetical protein
VTSSTTVRTSATAGVWGRLLEVVSQTYDDDIEMIDGTCVHDHQNGSTGKGTPTIVVSDAPRAASQEKSMQLLMQKVVRSIFALWGQVTYRPQAHDLMARVKKGDTVHVDKAHDTNAMRKTAVKR